jgi:hypothetical protein
MILRILKNLKQKVTQICQSMRLLKRTSNNGRPRKINEIDALTLSLYQHTSTRATKKSVYEDLKDELNCSYKTLVVSMNASVELALYILGVIMQSNKANTHMVKYTDATDIPVCLKKNADSHKTMKEYSTLGRSTKGYYYGLKMTMTRDAEGRLLGIHFSNATANDRDIFRKINKDIHGIIVADAGYVSYALEKDMYIENKRWCLIRPYKTMKKLMTDWQAWLYRGRFDIEFDFRDLKLFHGLITSLTRSVRGYIANYIHALTSFVLA